MEGTLHFSECAPAALFVYNREEHTQQTVEALQKNMLAQQTDLYIFSDAPKKEEDVSKVKAVREYVKSIPKDGFRNINLIEQDTNKGLAKSIIDGVTYVIEKYGKVIVLEDDLVTSKYFLRYMNEGLEKYKDSASVFSICGYSYFAEQGYRIDKWVVPEFYFLDYFCSWGWATWEGKWRYFDAEAKGWEQLKSDYKLLHRFSYSGMRSSDGLMLIRQMESGLDSWAIRWRWSIFKNNGLVLFPNRTMVKNIGWDGTGVHGAGGDSDRKVELSVKYAGKFPKGIREKKWIKRQMISAWKPSVPRRVVNKVRRLFCGDRKR